MHFIRSKKNILVLAGLLLTGVLAIHSYQNDDPVYKMKPVDFKTTRGFEEECWDPDEKTVTANDLDHSGTLVELEPMSLERGAYEFMVSYNTDSEDNYCVISSDREMDEEGNPGIVYDRQKLLPDKEGVMLYVTLPEDAVGVTLRIQYQGGYLKVNQIEFRSKKQYTDSLALYGAFLAGVLILWHALHKLSGRHTDQLILLVLVFEFFYVSCPLWNDFLVMGHDAEFHLGRIRGMYYCLRDRSLPMWINPFQGKEYGYASPIMYPQLFLWLPALLMSAGVSLLNAYKFLLVSMNLFTVLSSFWAFKRVFRDKMLGLLAGMAYSMSIYRMEALYTRGALGEALALTFLPLLVLGIYEVVFGNYRRWILLALGASAVISSHVLSTYLYAVCIGVFVLMSFHIVNKNELRRRIGAMLAAGGLTLLMSAYFLVPFLSYYGENFAAASAENMSSVMQAHGVYFSQMFATFTEEAGGSLVRGSTKGEMPLTVGGLFLMLLILTGLFLFDRNLNISFLYNKKQRYLITLVWVETVGVLLAASWLFPWRIVARIPILNRLNSMQFPWRLFAIAVLGGSILLGVFVREIIRKHPAFRKEITLLMMVIISLSSMPYLDSLRNMNTIYNETFSDTLGMTDSLYLYSSDDGNVWEKGIIVESTIPNTKIRGYSHRGQGTKFSYQLPEEGDEAVLTVPVYGYSGYFARVNGTNVPVERGTDGRLQVPVSDSEGEVEICFQAPWTWNAAYVISVLAVTVAVILERRSRKNTYEIRIDTMDQ